jgi:hypothetical protein
LVKKAPVLEEGEGTFVGGDRPFWEGEGGGRRRREEVGSGVCVAVSEVCLELFDGK